MHAIQLVAPSLTAFRSATLPDPEPGPGDVLVRLRAATLNYIDLAVATQRFPGAQFPMVPVADGAGEVVALGPDVAGSSDVRVGMRVVPHFMPDWQGGALQQPLVRRMRGISLPGSLADYVAVPADSVVAMPAHLDFAQGAALPVAATTAWNAVRAAQVRPGSVVVVLGTGGVSLFALQFAKASGATVILASSSPEKLERGRRLGADHLIDYAAHPDWDAAVLDITSGRGADLVVESVGGATFARSLAAAATGGTVFTVGFVSGAHATIDVLTVMSKALRIIGNSTGSVADLREAAHAIAAHGIVPAIDRRFAIAETAEAYAMLAEGRTHMGKLAILHGDA